MSFSSTYINNFTTKKNIKTRPIIAKLLTNTLPVPQKKILSIVCNDFNLPTQFLNLGQKKWFHVQDEVFFTTCTEFLIKKNILVVYKKLIKIEVFRVSQSCIIH